jgi:hypothetical protein
LGYAKAKTLAYVPLLLVFIVIFFAPSANGALELEGVERFITTHMALLYAAPVLIGAVLLIGSCALACRFYARREL